MSSKNYDQLIQSLKILEAEHQNTVAELEYTSQILQSYVQQEETRRKIVQNIEFPMTPKLQLWTEKSAILGQEMDETLRKIYTTIVTAYCDCYVHSKTISSVLSILDLYGVPPQCKHLERQFLQNLAMRLDSHMDLQHPIKSLLVSQLPRDIPCAEDLELFTIPETDQRGALRGHRGVRTTKQIRAGAYLGMYRGKAMLQSSFRKWKISSSPPTMNPIAFELFIDSYTASTTEYNVGKWAYDHGLHWLPFSKTKASENTLMVSANDEGNIMSYVNDPHLDPMGDSDESLGENATLCEVVLAGWPFIVMFATRDIGVGEEVLYSYGDAFWEYVEEHTLRLRHWMNV